MAEREICIRTFKKSWRVSLLGRYAGDSILEDCGIAERITLRTDDEIDGILTKGRRIAEDRWRTDFWLEKRRWTRISKETRKGDVEKGYFADGSGHLCTFDCLLFIF